MSQEIAAPRNVAHRKNRTLIFLGKFSFTKYFLTYIRIILFLIVASRRTKNSRNTFYKVVASRLTRRSDVENPHPSTPQQSVPMFKKV